MIVRGKKNLADNHFVSYIVLMKKKVEILEEDIAAIAKKYRQDAGKSRMQAAAELGVGRQAIFYAEDCPERSFFKLRKRIIEKYSSYKVAGPVFWLEKK